MKMLFDARHKLVAERVPINVVAHLKAKSLISVCNTLRCCHGVVDRDELEFKLTLLGVPLTGDPDLCMDDFNLGLDCYEEEGNCAVEISDDWSDGL